MKHKPIATAESLQHIRAARPKLAQALAAISGDTPTAHDLQAGMGQVMSASRCLKRAMGTGHTAGVGLGCERGA